MFMLRRYRRAKWNLCEAAIHGVMESCVARSVENVHVHYAGKQELRAMHCITRRSDVQRRLVQLVARIHVRLTIHQHIHRFLSKILVL